MKKSLIIILLLCTLPAVPGFSASLPVKNVKITSTFGESRKDHYHNGMDFGGGEQSVHAIQSGNVVYYSDHSEFPFQQYMGSGNYIIIQHNDNLRSYYLHLKDNSVDSSNSQVKEGQEIGTSSDTGHSYGTHLHFNLEKINPHEIINPICLFQDAIKDKYRPKIEDVYIKAKDDKLITLPGQYTLSPVNKFTLYVKCYDYLDNSANKAGPYKVTCLINKEKFIDLTFDRFIIKNNNYYLPPNYTFENLYLDDYTFCLGDCIVRQQEYDIEITVSDFFGNQTSVKKKIRIKE